MKEHKTIFPPRLQQGATIGIVAPSGRIHDHGLFERGIRILHEMGFQTKFPRKLWPGFDYFADSDSERSKEFNQIWNDPEVKAVMAARGGYGSMRMAQGIATEHILGNPKFFLGFSDITVLHSHLNRHAGLVTFHGPVVTSLPGLSKESLRSLNALLCGKVKEWKYIGNVEILIGYGTTTGVSTGGNLSTVVSAIGTQFDTSWKDKIVFLEDTNEPLYRIDRLLTQLSFSGKFDEAAAIILGDFSHGLALDKIETLRHHETIWKRVLELTGSATTVWANFPFGHGSRNHSFPLGAKLKLNSDIAEICFA